MPTLPVRKGCRCRGIPHPCTQSWGLRGTPLDLTSTPACRAGGGPRVPLGLTSTPACRAGGRPRVPLGLTSTPACRAGGLRGTPLDLTSTPGLQSWGAAQGASRPDLACVSPAHFIPTAEGDLAQPAREPGKAVLPRAVPAVLGSVCCAPPGSACSHHTLFPTSLLSYTVTRLLLRNPGTSEVTGGNTGPGRGVHSELPHEQGRLLPT